MQGDLGQSFKYRTNAMELVLQRLPQTLLLACTSILFATLVSIPLGVFAATRRGRVGDVFATGIAMLSSDGRFAVAAVSNLYCAILDDNEAHDYDVFRAGLEPLLKRIHRSIRHAGKKPRHREATAGVQQEWVELRRQLREAVDAEQYEEAARLRDLLRQKEATDESG